MSPIGRQYQQLIVQIKNKEKERPLSRELMPNPMAIKIT